jgi:hypothetical protein
VFVYYRDGEVSEGSVLDLDRYGSPTYFDTGNGRSADEILAVGKTKNGQRVTLFDHIDQF